MNRKGFAGRSAAAVLTVLMAACVCLCSAEASGMTGLRQAQRNARTGTVEEEPETGQDGPEQNSAEKKEEEKKEKEVREKEEKRAGEKDAAGTEADDAGAAAAGGKETADAAGGKGEDKEKEKGSGASEEGSADKADPPQSDGEGDKDEGDPSEVIDPAAGEEREKESGKERDSAGSGDTEAASDEVPAGGTEEAADPEKGGSGPDAQAADPQMTDPQTADPQAADLQTQDPQTAVPLLRAPVLKAAPQDASAHFHAQITSNNESYGSGTTAIYSVKYKLDRGEIHEGDTLLVTLPPDLVKTADFSVSSQHFSSVEDMGGGQYRLTFAKGAESALSGSFSMFLTTSEVEEQQTGPVTVGNDSSSITVNPKGPDGPGTGVLTDVINKDAFENDSVGYGDYDYSEGYGDSAAQIGVLKGEPGSIKYRLYINNKEAEISDITVKDSLPDGMEFDPDKGVEVTERDSGSALDPGLYSVSKSGGRLVFKYPGTLTKALQINYWVVLSSGEPMKGKYTNRADITYKQDGTTYSDHRNYILQGSSYSAANGEKSVDKTEISDDPDDQMVTYTIKFWNDKGFEAGEISLVDDLDKYIKYVSATPNEYFSVTQDEADPQKIHIENTKAIDGSTTVYVRFQCDFSDVPAGYTVENTVGGNTTKTRKVAGEAVLKASKTVDGETPAEDQQFQFELLDEEGEVLQTAKNKGGEITFDPLAYGREDMGKTYTYRIREKEGQETELTLDTAVYTAVVEVAEEAQDGIIATTVRYEKDGETVEEAAFDNKTPKEPEEPEKPEKPEKPDKPDTPEEPEKPDTPDKPDTPEEPEKPDTPDTPEEPDKPDKPEEPEKPDTPQEPEKPEEPEKTVHRSYTAVKSSDTADQTVNPGDQIVYRIRVENTGDADLKGIWVRDYIPQYTKYVSAGQGGRRGAIDDRQHVDWFIRELPKGKETEVTFTVEVITCTPDQKVIRNTAYTEDTEKEEAPELNIPRNPKDVTNEVIHYLRTSKKEKGQTSGHSSGNRTSSPKTGDSTQIAGFVLTALLSAAAIAWLMRRASD